MEIKFLPNQQIKFVVALCIGITLLFCSSFAVIYSKLHESALSPRTQTGRTKYPLPETHLVDRFGTALPDDSLRRGKVVLVFVTPECGACRRESEFLKTVVNRSNNVKFYGVISFGDRKTSLESAENIFPFKVYYDDGGLAARLRFNRVPIKIFLQDGLIMRGWGGATTEDKAKDEFVKWLDSVADCEVADEAKTKCS